MNIYLAKRQRNGLANAFLDWNKIETSKVAKSNAIGQVYTRQDALFRSIDEHIDILRIALQDEGTEEQQLSSCFCSKEYTRTM